MPVRLATVSATQVPGYEVGDVLGRAGTRVVHRARRLADDREVAVRVDTRTVPDERRFREDLRTAVRLSAHPYVVEVHDGGVLPDGRPYLVTERCPDGSLTRRVPLAPDEVAEVGRRIADVLVAAHDLGLSHGGIVPGELMVKPAGTVGLAGFGLASLNGSGTDVRDLTATLYELMAGAPPADPVADLPEVSAEFMAILRRGLAGGCPDAAALRVDLSQLTVTVAPRRPLAPPATAPPADSDDGPGPAGRPAAGGAPEPDGPGRPVLVVSVLVVALVVVVVGWWLLAS